MRWWQGLLLLLGALAALEVVLQIAKRWIYLRARDLTDLAEHLWRLIDFQVDGSALNLCPVGSRIRVRFEKASDDQGNLCRLVFPDDGENSVHLPAVREALECEGLEFDVDSDSRHGKRPRTIVSAPIRSAWHAARIAVRVFDAVGVDADKGLRFRVEGHGDRRKLSQYYRKHYGPGWWKPWNW